MRIKVDFEKKASRDPNALPAKQRKAGAMNHRFDTRKSNKIKRELEEEVETARKVLRCKQFCGD